jgi:hypothetical protein
MLGTVSTDLLRKVRAKIREKNSNSVTDQDVYDELNRGYDYAMDVLSRYYPDVLVGPPREITISGDTAVLPEDIFEDRIMKVDVRINNSTDLRELERISYRNSTDLQNVTNNNQPDAYVINRRTIRFIPPPNSNNTYLIYFAEQVEEIVPDQGRITDTSLVASSNKISLDSIGSDLSTATTDNKNYANIVDGQTGEIKATIKIVAIDSTNNTITFASSVTDTKVLNRDINTSLTVGTDIDKNDRVCLIHGSSVLYYPKPTRNMIVQFAVTEIRRSLGADVGSEERALKRMEDQVKRTWAGRETSLRIKRRNRIWKRGMVRYFYSV